MFFIGSILGPSKTISQIELSSISENRIAIYSSKESRKIICRAQQLMDAVRASLLRRNTQNFRLGWVGSSVLDACVTPVPHSDIDLSVVLIRKGDKTEALYEIEDIFKDAINHLLNTKISEPLNSFRPHKKFSQFLSPEHSITAFSFRGDVGQLPIECVGHVVESEDYPLHVTNVDSFVASPSEDGTHYHLFSKEGAFEAVAENVRNRVITSSVATKLHGAGWFRYLMLVSKGYSDPYSLNELFYAIDVKNKQESLVFQLFQFVNKKRGDFSYKIIICLNAIFSLPKGDVQKVFFLKALIGFLAEIPKENVWIRLLQKELSFLEENLMPSFLKSILPLLADRVVWKNHLGNFSLQCAFLEGYVVVPLIDEGDLIETTDISDPYAFDLKEQLIKFDSTFFSFLQTKIPRNILLAWLLKFPQLAPSFLKEEAERSLLKGELCPLIAFLVIEPDLRKRIKDLLLERKEIAALSLMLLSKSLSFQHIESIASRCDLECLTEIEIKHLLENIPYLTGALLRAPYHVFKEGSAFFLVLLNLMNLPIDKQYKNRISCGVIREFLMKGSNWIVEHLWTQFSYLLERARDLDLPTLPWGRILTALVLDPPDNKSDFFLCFLRNLTSFTNPILSGEEERFTFFLNAFALLGEIDYLKQLLDFEVNQTRLDMVSDKSFTDQKVFELGLFKVGSVLKSLSLLRYQSRIFGSLSALKGYLRLLQQDSQNEQVRLACFQSFSQLVITEENMWQVYQEVYLEPKLAEVIERKFLLDSDKLFGLSSSTDVSLKALLFRIDLYSQEKKGGVVCLLARYLDKLGLDQGSIVKILTHAFLSSEKKDKVVKFLTLYFERMMPFVFEELLQSKDLKCPHLFISKLREIPLWKIDDSIRDKGFSAFLKSLNDFLKDSEELLFFAKMYLDTAKDSERLDLTIRCSQIGGFFEVVQKLFFLSMSSVQNPQAFLATFDESIDLMQKWFSLLIQTDKVKSTYVHAFLSKIENYSDSNFLIEKILPYLDEELTVFFIEKIKNQINNRGSVFSWIAFLSTKGIFDICSKDLDLYLFFLKLVSKHFEQSKDRQLNKKIQKVLEYYVSNNFKLDEEILQLYLKLADHLKIDWWGISRKIVRELENQSFQKILKQISKHFPHASFLFIDAIFQRPDLINSRDISLRSLHHHLKILETPSFDEVIGSHLYPLSEYLISFSKEPSALLSECSKKVIVAAMRLEKKEPLINLVTEVHWFRMTQVMQSGSEENILLDLSMYFLYLEENLKLRKLLGWEFSLSKLSSTLTYFTHKKKEGRKDSINAVLENIINHVCYPGLESPFSAELAIFALQLIHNEDEKICDLTKDEFQELNVSIKLLEFIFNSPWISRRQFYPVLSLFSYIMGKVVIASHAQTLRDNKEPTTVTLQVDSAFECSVVARCYESFKEMGPLQSIEDVEAVIFFIRYICLRSKINPEIGSIVDLIECFTPLVDFSVLAPLEALTAIMPIVEISRSFMVQIIQKIEGSKEGEEAKEIVLNVLKNHLDFYDQTGRWRRASSDEDHIKLL